MSKGVDIEIAAAFARLAERLPVARVDRLPEQWNGLAKQCIVSIACCISVFAVSRPAKLNLKPLAEPFVRLSPYTAPVIQPIPQRDASGQTT